MVNLLVKFCQYLSQFPSLLMMLHGPGIDVPQDFLTNALMDNASADECCKLESAHCTSIVQPEMVSDILSMSSRLGCREISTPSNLSQLIVQVGQFEFWLALFL